MSEEGPDHVVRRRVHTAFPRPGPARATAGSERSRRSGRQARLLTTVVCVVLVAMMGAEGPAAGRPFFFGTLTSDPRYTEIEAASGIRVAMLELSWRDYEPVRGVWNEPYVRDQQERLRSLLASSRRLTLALGIYDPPAWSFELADSRYVDERGLPSTQLNVVFNEQVRTAAARYLQRVAYDLGLHNFWSVRVTSGGSSEVLFPDGGYWAFDANALGGPLLPPTLSPNPLPGWRPGEEDVPISQVAQWADWYVAALADVVDWQMAILASLEFDGYFEVVTPGVGVLPRAYTALIAEYLPRSLLGVGAVWDRFYGFLRTKRNVVAYVSSMADRSGANDGCAQADRSVAFDDPAVEDWSAVRWISRVAEEYGLLKRGENPGFNAPATLNADYQDPTVEGMMSVAFRQMESCGFQGIYWAHDGQLWDGTIDFTQYAKLIRAVNGPHGSLPDLAP